MARPSGHWRMGRLAGDVTVLGIAELFQHLTQNEREGVLTIRQGVHEKRVHFGPHGLRLLHTTTRRKNPLGEILIRTRKITRRQLDELLLEQKRTGKRLGEIVAALGIVSKRDLSRALREQVEDEIYELFTWLEAAFEFVQGPADFRPDTPLSEPVLQASATTIMLEAARRADELQLIMKTIRNDQALPVRTEHLFEAKEAGEHADAAEAVYAQVDGRRTLREVVDHSLFPRFDALRALYILAQRDFIRLEERGEPAPSPDLKELALQGEALPSGPATEGTERASEVQVSAEAPSKKNEPEPAPSRRGRKKQPEEAATRLRVQRPTVLLLGEMLKFRSLLANILLENGYEVVEELPENAEVILAGGPQPHAVLLDLGITVGDRYEFCRRVASASGAPLIVLGTEDSEECSRLMQEAGARSYLAKPIRGRTVLEALEAVLHPA